MTVMARRDMGERTEHTRQVFACLNQLKRDRDLSAFVVAFEIAQHINHKSGEGYPSSTRIAKNLRLSHSTVLEAVERLEARGHLGIEHGMQGRGHSNRYRMIIKPRPADVSQRAKNVGQPESENVGQPEENVGQPT